MIFFTVFAAVSFWISGYIENKFHPSQQVSKFISAGALNTFVDLGVLNILIALTGLMAGLAYAALKTASFAVAHMNSYVWHKYWTFESKGKATVKEIGRFTFVGIIGMLINVALAASVVELAGASGVLTAKQWASAGALIATLASLILRFRGYKSLVFK